LVPPQSHFVSSNSSEFNWGDAGIGATVVFALMLLGFAIVLTRHGRRNRLAAT
jgi:hypothetical protein